MPQKTDVAARKPLESELQEALVRYRAILSSTLDPVVTIDAHGIIQDASDSVRRVFGWEPQELRGRNVSVLMPDPYHSAHDGYLAAYRRTGATTILGRTREFTGRRKDGSVFPIEISIARVDVPGREQPLFTGILRDVTERKRAEEELSRHREHLQELVAERTRELEASHEQLRTADRLATIGTLAAGLGHDMNNVLLPLRCRLDALEAESLTAAAHGHFTAVRKSADYLQQLADGLHLLALDAEDAEPSGEGTDLASWWEQVGPLLARGLPRHVRLATSWPSALPPVGVAPHRLTQAVLNLVVNAGEAVGEDGKLRIWAEADPDGRFVRLGVSDNGCGMTPEVKRRALDPFFTTKKRGLGTGLGLSLVQGVARSAGGSVHIDSAPGAGTTITLVLPVHERPTHGADAPPAPEPQATVTVAERRLASLISTMLGAAGFAVSNGAGGPPRGGRWVTDASPDTLEKARVFLAGAGAGVLVLGPGAGDWQAIGAIPVRRPDDFEELRERIDEAASRLTGA